MKIENEFRVSVPIEQAWAVLTDLEGIAPCLPGAQLTGHEGEAFVGRVKIKVGPVTSDYAGTASFLEKDAVAYRAVIDAKGKDSRGAGNASALITARLSRQGTQTVVNVDTDLKISGKIAQLGSGMVKEVSAKLLDQFVACLETKLAAPPEAPPPAARRGGKHAAEPDPDEPAAADTGQPPPAKLRAVAPAPEPAALDLMELAGTAVYKRLIPVLGAAVLIVTVIVYRRRAR